MATALVTSDYRIYWLASDCETCIAGITDEGVLETLGGFAIDIEFASDQPITIDINVPLASDVYVAGIDIDMQQTAAYAGPTDIECGGILGIRADVHIDDDITDAYGVMARVYMTGADIGGVNQFAAVLGQLSTVATTIGEYGNLSALQAIVSGSADIDTYEFGKVSGLYVAWQESAITTADTAGVYIGNFLNMILDSGVLVSTAGITGAAFHSKLQVFGTITIGLHLEGAHTTGINVDGLVSNRVLQYRTTTAVTGDDGHCIGYGTIAAPILFVPGSGDDDCSAALFSISADDAVRPIYGISSRVVLTGGTEKAAYAGCFWSKIVTADGHTGDYMSGNPSGCIGLIEIADGGVVNADSIYSVMSGVQGEVRPCLGTVSELGVLCAVRAAVQTNVDQVNNANTTLCGIFVQALNAVADTGILIQPHATCTFTVGIDLDSSLAGAAIGTGIAFTGLITTRVIEYTDVTSVLGYNGHFIGYGTAAAPIELTPLAGGNDCCGALFSVFSDACITTSVAGIRARVKLMGETKAAAYAGEFWTQIGAGATHTGDYMTGNPVGLKGVIEIAATATVTSPSEWANMAGICGEVRPITAGDVTKTGTIAGVWALVQADTGGITDGKLVGVLASCFGGIGDVGVLIQPHQANVWTVGLELDSDEHHGTIGTGIKIDGTITTSSIVIGGDAAIDFDTNADINVAIYSNFTGDVAFFRGMYVLSTYTPTGDAGEASVYGIRGHAYLAANMTHNAGAETDESFCGVHGYVSGGSGSNFNGAGVTVAGLKGEVGGTGPMAVVKVACGVWAKVDLEDSDMTGVYTGVYVYAPNGSEVVDSAMYAWGYIETGIDLSGAVNMVYQMKLSNGVYFMTGSADPNGSVTAVDGSIYLRTGTATANTILYVCKGTTNWEALGTT